MNELVAIILFFFVFKAFFYIWVMREARKSSSPRMTSSTLSGESLKEMKARMKTNSRCRLKQDKLFEDTGDVEVCPISKRLPSTLCRGITGTPFPQNPDSEYAPFEDREVDICETLITKQ